MPRYLTLNQTEKCVMARVRRHTVLYQENFTLKQFGTYKQAIVAASAWVKDSLAQLPPPLTARDRKTKRNTSGVVGVRLANATRRKNGNVYPDWRWVAFWPECPNPGGIGWSVKKYGDKRAFVCAYLAREMVSVDREVIDEEFLKLQNSSQYRQVLKHKLISPP